MRDVYMQCMHFWRSFLSHLGYLLYAKGTKHWALGHDVNDLVSQWVAGSQSWSG